MARVWVGFLGAAILCGVNLRAQSSVVGWGTSSYHELDIPSGLTNVVSIAAAGGHGIALNGDGSVVEWGHPRSDSLSLMTVPPGLTHVVAVAAGVDHDLALKADGTVVAWGRNDAGQSSVPGWLANVIAVAAGGDSSLALRSDGTVVAWGNNNYGQTNLPPDLTNVVAISAYTDFSVAAKADGTVVAWGNPALTNVPPDLTNVNSVAAGEFFCATLSNDGTVSGWGPYTDPASLPVGLSNVVAIVAGYSSIMVLKSDGTADSWGDSHNEQILVPYGLSNLSCIAVSDYDEFALVADGRPRKTLLTDQTVAIGGMVRLHAVSSGSGPYTYDWRLNGQSLPDATNAWLVLTNLQTNQAGAYSVLVGNSAGTTLSSEGSVRVWPLTIDVQPISQRAFPDSTARFSVKASGVQPISYQWFRNGVALPGANNSTLNLDGLTFAQSGDYSVVVSNSLMTSTSVVANLSVTMVTAWGDNSDGQLDVPACLTNVVAISAGYDHSMALNADGTVVAWGNNQSGQTNVPPGLANVIAVGAGFRFSVALKRDGTLVGWGENYNGQLNIPVTATNLVALAVGDANVLALRKDGTLVAWGLNQSGQTNVPSDLADVISIAASSTVSLALKSDGTVVQWGCQGMIPPFPPVPFGLTDVTAIAASYQGLAIKADGTLVGWGTEIPMGLTNAVAVSANGWNSMALTSEGTVVAWGIYDRGQTNVSANATNVAAISMGGAHGLALAAHGPPRIVTQRPDQTGFVGRTTRLIVNATGAQPLSYQWHLNGEDLPDATNSILTLTSVQASQAGTYSVTVSNPLGQMTSSNQNLTVAPLEITAQPRSMAVYPGGVAQFAVAVSSTEPVSYQWQFNGANILGATGSSFTLPQSKFENFGSYTVVASNAYGAVTSNPAILAGYTVRTWGKNIPSCDATDIIAVSAGELHCVGLRDNGTVFAWGNNTYGQTNVPPGLSDVTALAAGNSFNLALRKNGTVVAWGDDRSGQVNVPNSLSNVVAIAAGDDHSLALKKDGTLVGWGYEVIGTSNLMARLTNVIAIAAGDYHSLALRSDGRVVAWGVNDWGQTNVPGNLEGVIAIAGGHRSSLALRSDGTVVSWGMPNPDNEVPAGLKNVVAIAAFYESSMALKSDGTVVTWGYNDYTGVHVPVGLTNVVGIAIGYGFGVAVLPSGAPRIAVQPASQISAIGCTNYLSVTLSPLVVGPVTYQWRLNGVDLVGATNQILTLAGVNTNQAGLYSVVIRNPIRAITSSEAEVVVAPAAVLVQPTNQTGWPGGSASFNAVVQSEEPVSYQWRFNGIDLVGETNNSLVVSNLQYANAGGYSVVTHNSYGFANSSDATLTVAEVFAWGRNTDQQTNLPVGLTNIASIASGGFHTLALRRDGTVAAWGKNWNRQTNVPTQATDVIAIAAGGDHSLALKSDGTVVAWGRTNDGQIYVPANATNVVAISAGWAHSVALRADGTVVSWGNDDYGQCELSATATEVMAVAAGYYHTLALRADGTVISWGDPFVPASATNVTSIAAGWGHSLALRADGTVLAWGDNTFGQATVPASATNVVAISAGWYHSMAVRADGTTIVWGKNVKGLTSVPAGLTNLVQVAAGEDHCVVLAGAGIPRFQQQRSTIAAGPGGMVLLRPTLIGFGAYQWYHNGVVIPGATNKFFAVPHLGQNDVGGYVLVASNSCGSATNQPITVTMQQSAVNYSLVGAWGDNIDKQCAVPVNLTNPVAIAAGAFHNLALLQDGSIASWGKTNGLLPKPVESPLTGFTAIAAGCDFSLAIHNWFGEPPQVMAWGRNWAGQTNVPAAATNPIAIAAGWAHALVLRKDGAVVAWGNNDYGQTDVPVDLTNAVAIAAGYYHNLAIRANHTVVAWGTDDPIPAAATNVIAVAAGWEHSLALRADGTIVAWGDNSYGQTSVPASAVNVVAIAAGYGHSLALRADGTCIAWGKNRFGVTNVPYDLHNVGAIACGEDHDLALAKLSPPVITSQPQSITLYTGDQALFVPGVDGTMPMSYQWYQNGNQLPGATNQYFVLSSVRESDAGTYTLYTRNPFGTASSSAAVLTVIVRTRPAFDLSPGALVFDNGGFSMRMQGLSGHGSIIVLGSTNLVDWQPILTNSPIGGIVNLIDTNAVVLPTQFYRILEQ